MRCILPARGKIKDRERYEAGGKRVDGMNTAVATASDDFLTGIKDRNPGEPEFLQAVEEVVHSIMPWYVEQNEYRKLRILERLAEPDRIIAFRITWVDDLGEVRINRGWRVQFSHALGPYKGGLRFSPRVNQSVLKFLGFEQVLKNSLTGLPLGGAKGGSDFNPRGKSTTEVMRFCQAFMTELYHHIGSQTDVPAGDTGVGTREIGYLFGQYMRLANAWNGSITGKGTSYGGSAIRNEATGYGCVYFCENMLAESKQHIVGKTISISGSGNVALHAARKAIERGARVQTLSNSDGYAFFKDGLKREHLDIILAMRENGGGRLADFVGDCREAAFYPGAKPWQVPCDIAMPCATQGEIFASDAKVLVENGLSVVVEGANMPLTRDAASVISECGVLHGPGKAANAGGVAVSGFEQSQNAMYQSWSAEDVDARLKDVMRRIHEACVAHAPQGNNIDYVAGANIAGFQRVSRAMYGLGVF